MTALKRENYVCVDNYTLRSFIFSNEDRVVIESLYQRTRAIV